MKRLLFLAPIAVFVVVLVGFMAGLQRDPSILPSMLIGKPLPAFALAPMRPGGQGFTSAELVGQPVMVNVFASWCTVCKEEHPVLMALREQGVNIVGLDWREDADAGARWLAANGDPYAKTGNDASGRIGIDMGVSGAPETFVLDKRGRVRYRQVGEITPQVWSQTLGPLMARLRAES
ncbi:DsbE family thiol:disulfide interchange protein [Phenylobacterium sp.]|jgi:cytochrome c biogenesis protein CcmG/thiol:disulfide interchange protein DsbE|uniref:DsbE family thiol:disulfide interchange protein n=1 Tax=Phenylobacterium sp. TaxID=1871053 RepID=UPI002F408AE4